MNVKYELKETKKELTKQQRELKRLLKQGKYAGALEVIGCIIACVSVISTLEDVK